MRKTVRPAPYQKGYRSSMPVYLTEETSISRSGYLLTVLRGLKNIFRLVERCRLLYQWKRFFLRYGHGCDDVDTSGIGYEIHNRSCETYLWSILIIILFLLHLFCHLTMSLAMHPGLVFVNAKSSVGRCTKIIISYNQRLSEGLKNQCNE